MLKFSILVFCVISSCRAQTFNFETFLGTDPHLKKQSIHFGIDFGYSIIDKGNVHFGIRGIRYFIEPRRDLSDVEKQNITTDLYPIYFYTGSRFYLPLFKFAKGKENEGIVGIMPEGRLFFTPWNPREMKYKTIDGQYVTVTGKFQPHLCYGLGGGIYIERPNYGSVVVLKCEYTTMDAFKTLRTLDYGNKEVDFPGAVVITLGFSFFKWGFL